MPETAIRGITQPMSRLFEVTLWEVSSLCRLSWKEADYPARSSYLARFSRPSRGFSQLFYLMFLASALAQWSPKINRGPHKGYCKARRINAQGIRSTKVRLPPPHPSLEKPFTKIHHRGHEKQTLERTFTMCAYAKKWENLSTIGTRSNELERSWYIIHTSDRVFRSFIKQVGRATLIS